MKYRVVPVTVLVTNVIGGRTIENYWKVETLKRFFFWSYWSQHCTVATKERALEVIAHLEQAPELK